MTDCVCSNKIYQAVLNPDEFEETGNANLGWVHAAVLTADNPIEEAIRLDNDHTGKPLEIEN